MTICAQEDKRARTQRIGTTPAGKKLYGKSDSSGSKGKGCAKIKEGISCSYQLNLGCL
jgi:hypothetical protein